MRFKSFVFKNKQASFAIDDEVSYITDKDGYQNRMWIALNFVKKENKSAIVFYFWIFKFAFAWVK